MTSPHLVMLLGALALACHPRAPGEDTGSSDGSEGVGSTSGGPVDPTSTASTGTDGGDESTSTGTRPEPTTGSTSEPTTGTTGLADDCASLDSEEQCEDVPKCAPVRGIAQEFAGCSFGSHYLGCIDQVPCDAIETTICRDGTDEVYEIGDGCVPPGFSPCAGPGEICPADCESIVSPVECANKQCRVVYAAPHIMVDGEVCASYGDDEEFLGCIAVDSACVNETIIICPEGQESPSWDSASGCVPVGFATCDAPPVPACR